MQKLLLKKELNSFISNLIKKHNVVGPVKNENTKFKILEKPKELYLKNITEVPVKKFFIPDHETLLDFKGKKIIEYSNKTIKTILFGLRKCDLNAIQILDLIMKDPLYIKKRKNIITIGFYCESPDKYCFCNSMNLNDKCYDLFFYPDKDYYYISIGSNKGLQLVKNLPNAKKQVIKQPKNSKALKEKEISRFYKNKIWQTEANKCLSCSACTVYCPTCNCFDIYDNLNINLKEGSRHRKEASCQLKSFSRVAGGKIFRDSRLSRFKHFVYHKIDYFKKSHKRYMCVGCGRCLRVCPTKIDWVRTINLLKNMKKQK